MKIGIIGYRGHSYKLLKILIKNFSSFEYIVFCRKKILVDELNNKIINSNIYYTANKKDLLSCKAVMISSRSNSHAKYIKYLKEKNMYIFCEKPACLNMSEYKFLSKLNVKEKKKIYFNYNFRKSKLYNDLKSILSNKKYGKLIFLNVNVSHGLAFKKNYKDNWRLKSKNVFDRVAGNLGCHYINFLSGLIGHPVETEILEYQVSKKKIYDTAIINTRYKNGIFSKIFLTYASAFTKSISLYFTNAIVEFEDNKLSIFYPRDTFNSRGSFKKPRKMQTISYKHDYAESSLEISVKYFMEKVLKNKYFLMKDYNEGLITSKNIINAISKKL